MAKTMEEVLERFRTIEFHDNFDMIVAIAQWRYCSGRHHQSAFTKRSAPAAHQFEGRIPTS